MIYWNLFSCREFLFEDGSKKFARPSLDRLKKATSLFLIPSFFCIHFVTTDKVSRVTAKVFPLILSIGAEVILIVVARRCLAAAAKRKIACQPMYRIIHVDKDVSNSEEEIIRKALEIAQGDFSSGKNVNFQELNLKKFYEIVFDNHLLRNFKILTLFFQKLQENEIRKAQDAFIECLPQGGMPCITFRSADFCEDGRFPYHSNLFLPALLFIHACFYSNAGQYLGSSQMQRQLKELFNEVVIREFEAHFDICSLNACLKDVYQFEKNNNERETRWLAAEKNFYQLVDELFPDNRQVELKNAQTNHFS